MVAVGVAVVDTVVRSCRYCGCSIVVVVQVVVVVVVVIMVAVVLEYFAVKSQALCTYVTIQYLPRFYFCKYSQK